MTNLKNVKLCVFDAYGTLFDINSVTNSHCKKLGNIATPFSNLWRTKQLEYTWLRSLMNTYNDFWCVTEESLDYTLNYFKINDDYLKNTLLKSYENINCYKEVSDTLCKLKEKGIPLAILSNASPSMLYMAVKNSKIDCYIDSCLSADSVKIYKPNSTVYNLILEKYNVNKNEVLFISSNFWDISGAKNFGFNVAWINRFNSIKDNLPSKPDIELKSLSELLNIF